MKIKLLSIKKLKSGKKKYEAKFEITEKNGKIKKKNYKIWCIWYVRLHYT